MKLTGGTADHPYLTDMVMSVTTIHFFILETNWFVDAIAELTLMIGQNNTVELIAAIADTKTKEITASCYIRYIEYEKAFIHTPKDLPVMSLYYYMYSLNCRCVVAELSLSPRFFIQQPIAQTTKIRNTPLSYQPAITKKGVPSYMYYHLHVTIDDVPLTRITIYILTINDVSFYMYSLYDRHRCE